MVERMRCEQAFGEFVDTEHLFVLQGRSSEQVFENGDAMSVALEVEYEAFYPRLSVVPDMPGRKKPSARVQRRRVVLGFVLVVLLVGLVLPISALGGRTIAGSVPAAGQEYVVQSGDTLASVAARVGGGSSGANISAIERQLAREAGSNVLVPGERLLIP
jgi:hypothetical protein